MIDGGLRALPIPPLPGASFLRDALCGLDPRMLWGTMDMLPWLFVPSLWQQRLLQGNGLDNAGAARSTRLLALPDVNPYGAFAARLAARTDLLVFPYDWRLSNDVTANRLAAAIRARWPTISAPDERVTIVAHSMGGLVSRYYIEALGGHQSVKQLITVGTPHQGSPMSYTNYYGHTLAFGWIINVNNLVRWLTLAVGPAPAVVLEMLHLQVRALLGYLMPPAMQIRLARSYASALQLLPTYPFVRRGGRLEAIVDTYRGMTHLPTGQAAASVQDRLQSALIPASRLNSWLAGVGTQYHCLGSRGLSTLQSYDADSHTLARDMEGDGTVPLISALLPAGSNVATHTFSGFEHQQLLEQADVQNHCLALIAPTGVREMERELERLAVLV
jgi:pimeloyl-ACP methyl ester carboxylesterase